MTIGADKKPTAYLHGGDRTRSTRPIHAASPVTTGAHKSRPPAQFERWIPVVTGKTRRGLAPGPAKAGAGKTGEDLPPCVIPDAQRQGIQPEVSSPPRQPEKPVDGSSDGLHPSRMTIGADQKPTAYLHGGDRTRSTRPIHAVSPVTTGAHKSCPPAQFERWIPVVTGNTGRRLAPEPAKAGAAKTGRGPPPLRHPRRTASGDPA